MKPITLQRSRYSSRWCCLELRYSDSQQRLHPSSRTNSSCWTFRQGRNNGYTIWWVEELQIFKQLFWDSVSCRCGVVSADRAFVRHATPAVQDRRRWSNGIARACRRSSADSSTRAQRYRREARLKDKNKELRRRRHRTVQRCKKANGWKWSWRTRKEEIQIIIN